MKQEELDERIKKFVKEFERIYVEELLEVLSKNEELSNNTWLIVYEYQESRIVGSDLFEKYMVDSNLLIFLENNSDLKGKSLTMFLWFYFKKKLNQDFVEFLSKVLDETYRLNETYRTISEISEKAIKEANNNLIKLYEKKEILNNKKREISH